MAQLSLQYEDELAKYANLLEDVIEKMDFSDKCHGFILDGEAAGSLEGHFTSHGTRERFVSSISRSVGHSN